MVPKPMGWKKYAGMCWNVSDLRKSLKITDGASIGFVWEQDSIFFGLRSRGWAGFFILVQSKFIKRHCPISEVGTSFFLFNLYYWKALFKFLLIIISLKKSSSSKLIKDVCLYITITFLSTIS